MDAHALLEHPARAASVVAPLGYYKPNGERPYDYACEPPHGAAWQNYEIDARPTEITDARELPSRPSIAREGFALWDMPSRVRDFLDEETIKRAYYAECAELALAATGAQRAYVFDHLVRKRDVDSSTLGFGRRVSGPRPSANGRVHNDYTEGSGRKRLEIVLGSEAAAAMVRRHAIVNIWRPLKGPVLDAPLALCNARTVAPGDLVAADVHYATRTGEIYLVQHSERHRWFYYPAMRPQEALVFKQYDSLLRGAPRFVPHAAFDDPHAPADAPPRESIEARCLVVYD